MDTLEHLEKELEALLWICFSSRYLFLIFKEKIFFQLFSVENFLVAKNYLHFQCINGSVIGDQKNFDGKKLKCFSLKIKNRYLELKHRASNSFSKCSNVSIVVFLPKLSDPMVPPGDML